MGSLFDRNDRQETGGIIEYPTYEYKNVCFTAYRWDEDGNTWILLGKEQRRKSGTVWFDFCGGKEPEDENSWQTALREASEETAGQLEFRKGMTLTYRGRRNRDAIHYIARVQNIDPYFIEQAAEKLRKEGRGKGIEKTKWRWVQLQNLLDDTSGLNLYWSLKQKLKNPIMRKFFESLISQGKLNKEPLEKIELKTINHLKEKLDAIIALEDKSIGQLKQIEKDIQEFGKLTGEEERYSQLFINVLEEIAIREVPEQVAQEEVLQRED